MFNVQGCTSVRLIYKAKAMITITTNRPKHTCKKPTECERKRERWKELQDKYCELGQQELDNFLGKLRKGSSSIKMDKHFIKRSNERSISSKDVKEVLDNGWVIERNQTAEKGAAIVVMCYVGKFYRPIHVVLCIVSPNVWVAVTAYDPRSHAWKWSKTFDERVCFCKEDAIF